MVYNAKSAPVRAHKCACGLRKVRRCGNSAVAIYIYIYSGGPARTRFPAGDRFPAGTLRYNETEIIYGFSKVLGAGNLSLARVPRSHPSGWILYSCVRTHTLEYKIYRYTIYYYSLEVVK